jgi:gluconolactonase
MKPPITRAPCRLTKSFASLLGLGLAWSLAIFADDLTPRPTMGEILRFDPAADSLLAPDAKIEVLASGLDWSEGPVWIPKAETQVGGGGYLVFSDVPRNQVMKWKEGDGLTLFLKPSGYTGLGEYSPEPGSNGLNLNSRGELISCEHGDRRISVLTRNGGKRTLADNFEGKRFSSPNDSTIDRAGNIYFTDPPYGLPKGPQDTETREIPWNGIYKLAPNGKVTLMSKEMTFPNGIALSPDQKTLYVSQSDPKAAIWKAFPIEPDGSLGPSRVLADVTAMVSEHRGLPDGMKTDTAGHIWSAGPGGVHVMTAEGKLLARIDTKMACGNCCFGDDGSWLYICSDAFVVRVKTKAKGTGF